MAKKADWNTLVAVANGQNRVQPNNRVIASNEYGDVYVAEKEEPKTMKQIVKATMPNIRRDIAHAQNTGQRNTWSYYPTGVDTQAQWADFVERLNRKLPDPFKASHCTTAWENQDGYSISW